jgi:hypothetical protein
MLMYFFFFFFVFPYLLAGNRHLYKEIKYIGTIISYLYTERIKPNVCQAFKERRKSTSNSKIIMSVSVLYIDYECTKQFVFVWMCTCFVPVQRLGLFATRRKHNKNIGKEGAILLLFGLKIDK